jgi:hypothetical protein
LQTSTLSSAALETSLVALKQQQYAKAIGLLEAFCHDRALEAQLDRDYFRAQMHLIAVYEQQEQLDRAVALCRNLLHCPNAQVQIWAQQKLTMLAHPSALETFEAASGAAQIASDSPLGRLRRLFQPAG